MATHEDADLVQRFLRGEPAAAARIDGWIAAAAWSFRRRLLSEWDDLLQEIRLEALRLLGAGHFRGESRLKTYLWQVACHTCLDAVRRQRRRTFLDLDAIEAAPSGAPSPFDVLARREHRAAALRALETLSDECRDVWTRLLQGASYRDISRALAVSEGALRVRAHRCRKSAVEAYRAATRLAPRAAEGEDALP